MYDLKALKVAVDRACEEAFVKRKEFDEAINWGDLGCISARYIVDDDGGEFYQAFISEAAPECPSFCEFIYKRLCEAGFPGVEVFTEW